MRSYMIIGSQEYVSSPQRMEDTNMNASELSPVLSNNANKHFHGNSSGANTATTTPRSEFQAFANSILTPLSLGSGDALDMHSSDDDLSMPPIHASLHTESPLVATNLHGSHIIPPTSKDWVGIGFGLPSHSHSNANRLGTGTIAVGIGLDGPTDANIYDMEQYEENRKNGSNNRHRTDAHTNQGLGMREDDSNITFDSMLFASPTKTFQCNNEVSDGGSAVIDRSNVSSSSKPTSSYGMSLFGHLNYEKAQDQRGYQTNNPYQGQDVFSPTRQHAGGISNYYMHHDDGKSPSGGLMDLVLADSVVSSSKKKSGTGTLQGNQQALADRLKRSNSKKDRSHNTMEEDIFPTPPVLVGSKSPKLLGKKKVGGSNNGNKDSKDVLNSSVTSIGSIGSVTEKKRGKNSKKNKSNREERDVLNSSFGGYSDANSACSSGANSVNTSQHFISNVPGASLLYSSTESMPSHSQSSRRRNRSNSDDSDENSDAPMMTDFSQSNDGSDMNIPEGMMNVISQIATEELQSNPSPPLSITKQTKKAMKQHRLAQQQQMDTSMRNTTNTNYTMPDNGIIPNLSSNPNSQESSSQVGSYEMTPPQFGSPSSVPTVTCNCRKSRCLKL